MTPTPVEQTTFGDLTIRYDARLLQPRAWTAEQSRWAADLIAEAPDGPVLELCAGAGQIGLLAIALRPRPLVCVDVNPVARSYIEANAALAGLEDLVTVRIARIEDALVPGEEFAMVIADPPWVRRDDLGRYPEDVPLAIDGGADGLDIARVCLDTIARHLTPGGSALLQLGNRAQVDALAERSGDLALVEVRSYERGVVARFDSTACASRRTTAGSTTSHSGTPR